VRGKYLPTLHFLPGARHVACLCLAVMYRPKQNRTSTTSASAMREQRGAPSALRLLPMAGRKSIDEAAGIFPHLELIFDRIARSSQDYLSLIQGYASLIQDDNSEGNNTRRWADKIAHKVEQMDQYMNHLAMLRIRDAMVSEKSTWSEIVGTAVRQCEPVNRRGAEIEVHVAAMDPFQHRSQVLMRVVFQLLRNALESVEATGRVVMNVSRKEIARDSRKEFVVSIRDDGTGIEPGNAERIWNPFFTTRKGHIGLGLTFVSVVGAMLDFKVDVASAPGKGTAVTLIVTEEGDSSETQNLDCG